MDFTRGSPVIKELLLLGNTLHLATSPGALTQVTKYYIYFSYMNGQGIYLLRGRLRVNEKIGMTLVFHFLQDIGAK